MQVRGVILVTVALVLGIAALCFHLIALCSPSWKITVRDAEPKMVPVSYGLWERCEYQNITINKQGIALGTRPNVLTCWPNQYMRYSPENFHPCYSIRRECPIKEKKNLPEGCSCRYLSSTKVLQWLTVIAAIFLVLGLVLLYLKVIASPQNGLALLVLGYGPFVCFLLALLLMTTGLILICAYFRRDAYEDYSFPLKSIPIAEKEGKTFDLHSLRTYAKYHESTLNYESYVEAVKELIKKSKTHYHTKIGWATIYEIFATALILIITALSFWLAKTSRLEDI
ncbi:unnamed protein product [Rotaria magnacalcarata]|uniref:Uncharacterized protein n=2 Tax=Rotaria magnacalcarata TaxID=392030 RepID=A0A819H179_9BILA|nr:unnamed protein product [Rotaria magnacalcarata]CAF3895840.1 unnamed protein product [Rotaria magnacalcarata]CAF4056273.1 unnamed protein product [Rotaria magnacalcarata]CAF4104414.1 unnamed protein product [Rotaria magnacalcarata]